MLLLRASFSVSGWAAMRQVLLKFMPTGTNLERKLQATHHWERKRGGRAESGSAEPVLSYMWPSYSMWIETTFLCPARGSTLPAVTALVPRQPLAVPRSDPPRPCKDRQAPTARIWPKLWLPVRVHMCAHACIHTMSVHTYARPESRIGAMAFLIVTHRLTVANARRPRTSTGRAAASSS